MSQPNQLSRRKKAAFSVFLAVGVPIVAFILIEGGVSLGLLMVDLLKPKPLPPERRYSDYDPELGWRSRPNTLIHDMYGSGKYLRINAQGFRGNRDVGVVPPAGQVRVICSGDSFALGFGVSNDDAWCEKLRSHDSRIEPVNMGQAGYGLDQAYLWYMRDGQPLNPDIHLVTFIWAVIGRMNGATVGGYAKPLLKIEEGALKTVNVPVPRGTYRVPWLTTWLKEGREALRPLRSFELARRVRAGVTDRAAVRQTADSAAWRLAAKVIETLAAHHRDHGSTLVLVHLPAPDDPQNVSVALLDPALDTLAAQLGITYLDLSEDLARLPPDSADRVFIPGDGHYTELGNAWVARTLYTRALRDAVESHASRPSVGLRN